MARAAYSLKPRGPPTQARQSIEKLLATKPRNWREARTKQETIAWLRKFVRVSRGRAFFDVPGNPI